MDKSKFTKRKTPFFRAGRISQLIVNLCKYFSDLQKQKIAATKSLRIVLFLRATHILSNLTFPISYYMILSDNMRI